MRLVSLVWLAGALAACGSSVDSGADAAAEAAADGAGTSDGGGADAGAEVGAPDAAADASIGAADVLAKLGACKELTTSRYKTDDAPSSPADVPVCGLVNAVWFTADMDVDCDGKQTAQCNPNTDPAFQNQTAAVDSKNQPLDAANLPYVVVPSPSARWDYRTGPLQMGSVVLVIWKGKMQFGVLGDTGPTAIIGEASYAMASALGANPDPKVGGIDAKEVTYLLFTGKSGVVTKNEDHAEAVSVGQARLAQFMKEN